ncbi:hypothetical protein GTZ78_34800 [Streptomyces sp. SID8361]|uniref:hypothetical protein n=1 Tax=Streptomyces sp. MnatMP-M27 TaxID=1839768 RepID=UPI00081E56B6|nr:hypothetical protein [Streptomyces sp. MnatMP-M27]MYU15710.1 hypothetical protein [Streptomyces sp. SID8361]SCG10124.1 hypothetical protein GA0115260_110648 [Streptomyces sp. MnatMP-M27]
MLPTTKILEQDLLKVRGLVESLAAQWRSQTANDSLVTQLSVSRETLAEAAENFMSQASESLCLIIDERSETTTAVVAALRRIAPTLASDVTVRALVPPGSRTRWALDAVFPEEAEVRLAALPGLTAVVSDTESTLVSNTPGDPALIRSTSVATNLRALFDTIWPTAPVLDPRLRLREVAQAEELRRVLGCLQEGLIDDVAARKLSMSVRTYRRHVADIMALLRTNSRFQAGARAIETGLLPRRSTRVADGPVPADIVNRVSPACST